MAKHEATENKPKKRSRAGLVLLVLLLILAGAAGYLYYTVSKAPLELDDPQALVAAAPMSAGDRFAFSADGTAQVKLDKADLWHLILTQTGENFLDTINAEMKPYDLAVSGCAIGIDETGLRLDLELFCKEIRLVAQVLCTVEASGRNLTMTPTELKLGVISLPVEGILSSVNLDYELNLPVITEVKKFHLEQGAFVLTGPMEQDVLTLIPDDEKLELAAIFSAQQQTLVDYLRVRTDLTAVWSHLEQNPADVEKLYQGLFALADPRVTDVYMDNCHGMTRRFFPGINFSATTEEQIALIRQGDILTSGMNQLYTDLATYYNKLAFRLQNGEFLMNGKPFCIAEYGEVKYLTLFGVLDPEAMFMVLVDVEDGFTGESPHLNWMTDANQQFTEPVEFNQSYTLGCVFRSVDSDPFVMYEAEVHDGDTTYRAIVKRPLTEETVAALQTPGMIGVWTS